jgi:hypothetical protein
MALYDDGKIKFDDKWIEETTSDEDLREFLRIKRYNLVDRKNSPYCTLENLLYNTEVNELCDDAALFLQGRKGMTHKTYEKIFVLVESIVWPFRKRLEDIYEQMKKDNNWDV